MITCVIVILTLPTSCVGPKPGQKSNSRNGAKEVSGAVPAMLELQAKEGKDVWVALAPDRK